MFIIIKEIVGGFPSPYLGAVVRVQELPWLVTGLQGPTIYETEAEAIEAKEWYDKRGPKDKYRIISLQQYAANLKLDGRLLRANAAAYMGGNCLWIEGLMKKARDLDPG